MKKFVFLLVYILYAAVSIGQDAKPKFDGHAWQGPYSFDIPQGWGVERFELPPAFAPSIKYNGVEDIRFTPGWAKASGNEYWSYAFLWWLNGTVAMNGDIMRTNLQAYYDGLLKTNVEPQKYAAGKFPPAKVTVAMDRTKANGNQAFSGTVEMTDYMTLKPIRLNFTAELKRYREKNRTVIFYALSPRDPGDEVWISLHKLWATFAYPRLEMVNNH